MCELAPQLVLNTLSDLEVKIRLIMPNTYINKRHETSHFVDLKFQNLVLKTYKTLKKVLIFVLCFKIFIVLYYQNLNSFEWKIFKKAIFFCFSAFSSI